MLSESGVPGGAGFEIDGTMLLILKKVRERERERERYKMYACK